MQETYKEDMGAAISVLKNIHCYWWSNQGPQRHRGPTTCIVDKSSIY